LFSFIEFEFVAQYVWLIPSLVPSSDCHKMSTKIMKTESLWA